MNLERIKDLTGVAQNLLISLAVVVGGAWTIFMFWTERPEGGTRSVRPADHQRRSHGRADRLGRQGRPLCLCRRQLKNHGNLTGVIDLKATPPFRISRIAFSGERIAVGELQAPIAARNVTGTTSAALGAQAYDEYHVFVRVAEPGHYYVEFLAPLAESEFKVDKVLPLDAKNWWGATRLEVKKRDTTPPAR
jgi:hypothetical protein